MGSSSFSPIEPTPPRRRHGRVRASDRVCDADSEQLTRPSQPACVECLAHEGLQAAAVAARAGRALLGDRQVADLACPARAALVEAAADGNSAADAGSHRHEHGRVEATGGAELRLRERERSSVVDQGRRRTERLPDLRRQLHAPPVAGKVREERGHAASCVEEAGNAEPDRVDGADVGSDRDEPADDGFGPLAARVSSFPSATTASSSSTTHLMYVPPRSRPRCLTWSSSHRRR